MKSILVIGLFMAIFCVGTSIADGRGEHDEEDEGIMVGNTVLKVSKNGKIVIYKNVPEKGMPDVSDGEKPEGGKPDGEKPEGGKKPEGGEKPEGGKPGGGKKPEGDKPDKGGEHDGGKKGPGGKGPGGKGKKPRKTPAIEISMAEIKPRKMEGEGKGKKEMRDFAKQVFTLSAPVNTTVLDSGVAAVEVSATTTLTALNNTDLKFIIHIIKENGTITIGDEVQEVTVGMVKFSLEVSGGDWNDDMIVGLHLKSKGKPQKKDKTRGPPPGGNKKRAPEFSLGGDSFMQMSELVKVDNGAWQQQCMGADNTTYPLVKERGNMQIMIFCLPQFTSKAVIDPTFEAGNEAEPEDDENAATNVALSLAVLLLSSLIATLGW